MSFSTTATLPAASRGGGRIASDAYRRSLSFAADFTGLEQGADRYQLLLLVKRAGKSAGFTPRMIQLLDYYLAFTRDCDWEQGSRPVVYQSLSRTALDLGISERMVQKLEAALFGLGAITWHDSGNHKRYGQRCPQSGRLLYAFGVDLTPLAYLREELEAKLHEKRLYDEAWLETKRRISWLRRQLRAHLAEWGLRGGEQAEIGRFATRYDEIAVQLRTQLDLAAMRSLLARHESLHSELLTAMGVEEGKNVQHTQRVRIAEKTTIGSCTSEPAFMHYKSTTHSSNSLSSRNDEGFQESVADPAEEEDEGESPGQGSAGLEHVTLAMAIGASGPRLRERLPLGKVSWPALVEAAYQLRGPLGISQASWGEACEVLGRNGAALCLLLTDRASARPDDPVRVPAAYFRGMITKARAGELRLHASVFGLLEREALCG